MKIKIISFTQNGYELSKKIKEKLLNKYHIEVYAKEKFILKEDKDIIAVSSLDKFTSLNFNKETALIFIGATGIAVRAIAPYIKDKFKDPAVICIDEKAKFVIPLLSGHIGGANELANDLAINLSAINIITTATDINNKWAVDVWAKKNNLFISDRQLAKEISAKILNNNKIYIKSDFSLKINNNDIILLDNNDTTVPDVYISYKKNINYDKTLFLIPKALCLGIGCKKNTEEKKLILAFEEFIKNNNIYEEAIDVIASIDLKKEEKAILSLANRLNIETIFFTKEELNKLKAQFSSSDFVYKITGVDCVCERASYKVFENLLISKTSFSGITMALSINSNVEYKIDKI